jgi:7-carboxy-7-deazaguanine synthase
MRIAEIFRSLQGEGRLTGVESIFVRAGGCNLRCGYCDTPYASWTPEGEELSVAEVLDRVEQVRQSPRPAFLDSLAGQTFLPASEGSAAPNAVNHIVLTGGEPMLFAELVPLAAQLHERGWHITIETAGTLYQPVVCDLMSISPKLSNSCPLPLGDGPGARAAPTDEQDPQWAKLHAAHRHAPAIVHRLIAEHDYQLKFVIDCPADRGEVLAYLEEFPEIDRARVMLMPQGIDAQTLAEKALWLEPYCVAQGMTFCPRRQIEWFGAERGT